MLCVPSSLFYFFSERNGERNRGISPKTLFLGRGKSRARDIQFVSSEKFKRNLNLTQNLSPPTHPSRPTPQSAHSGTFCLRSQMSHDIYVGLDGSARVRGASGGQGGAGSRDVVESPPFRMTTGRNSTDLCLVGRFSPNKIEVLSAFYHADPDDEREGVGQRSADVKCFF